MTHNVASALSHALGQTWPPFVLVTGLLLVGAVAARDGVFEALGAKFARLGGGGLRLFISLMALVSAVTVVLNLDTSVVFLTPIVLHAARRRAMPEIAFLYGTVFMSNAASLLLPGSNLTNLLVIGPEHLSGISFAKIMAAPWVVAVLVTMIVIVVWKRDDLRQVTTPSSEVIELRVGIGLVAIACSVVCMLVLSNAALAVLVTGLAALFAQHIASSRLSLRELRKLIGPVTLSGLFVLAVVLGTIARWWGAPGRLMENVNVWATAGIGAAGALVLNNLPAAVLLSSLRPAHPEALLIGLDLGPNLAMTGALSALLWWRVSRACDARPSVVSYTRVGVIVPLSLGLATLALQL